MELRDIRYVFEIVKTENISQAAQSLHLPQPTLSNSLRRVEKELGQPLFARMPRGMQALESGKRFAEYAEQILDLCDQLVEDLTLDKMAPAQRIREIRIGFEPFHLHMFSHLAGYEDDFPDCRFVISSARPDALLQQIRTGALHFAIMRTPQETDGVRHSPLLKMRLFAACNPTSPVCKTAKYNSFYRCDCIRADSFQGQNLLLPERNDLLTQAVHRYLSSAGIQFTVNVPVDNATTACMLAAQNIGIAVIPDPSLSGALFSDLVQYCIENLSMEISLVYAAGFQPRIVQSCMDYCVEKLSHVQPYS